jgi:hypothetical protein
MPVKWDVMYMCVRVYILSISTIFLLNLCNCPESVVYFESDRGGNWNRLTIYKHDILAGVHILYLARRIVP